MALEKQELVLGVWTGYCPHPVTVDIRGPIKGYIYPCYTYYPTVSEGGSTQGMDSSS